MSEWAAWEKRKRTNKANLLGKFAENCPFCAHCTWIFVGKTNPERGHIGNGAQLGCHSPVSTSRQRENGPVLQSGPVRMIGVDEFFCHRVYADGMRVTVDMTGKVPEKCEHFELRSKYATNEI